MGHWRDWAAHALFWTGFLTIYALFGPSMLGAAFCGGFIVWGFLGILSGYWGGGVSTQYIRRLIQMLKDRGVTDL